jgi:uroporphyrinogen decarboxylase
MGYEDFFLTLYDDRDLIEAVMERFTKHTCTLVGELIERKVDMIYIPDDIAFGQGLMIDPEVFSKLWIPRMERIVGPVIDAEIPRVYHSDGKSEVFLPWIIDLGFQGITALEAQCNDIKEIKKKYGNKITLFGNFDVAGNLAFGTAEDVKKEVKDLIEYMKPYGGYVAMSGNSITNGVKPENYQAMIDIVKLYGRYE